jgi:hypothetical protein
MIPGIVAQQGEVVIEHFTHIFTPARKGNSKFFRPVILSG